MNELDSNFYRGQQANDTRIKRTKQAMQDHKNYHNSHEKYDLGQTEDFHQLKEENAKLKKLLKEAKAKRTHITKQCSEAVKRIEKLEEENERLRRKLKDDYGAQEGSQLRIDQLKFLNKELNNQIQELRRDNQELNEKVRYHTEIIQRKYEDLEERTFKRIQQALKRVKKGVHYLSTLTGKQFERTKEIQADNLKKAVEILKGKWSEDSYEKQIEQLMNPIKNMQQDLHQKSKQNTMLRQENQRMQHQLSKHKKIEKQLMPQYKQSIEKLKKGLAQMRSQLSENQYQKCQIKKKYEEKIKQLEIKYDEIFREHRKLKLENKIYEKKLEEMEGDIEEEKQRLMGENQLLKKLYKSQEDEQHRQEIRSMGGMIDVDHHRHMQEGMSYKTTTNYHHRMKDQFVIDDEGDDDFKAGDQYRGRRKYEGNGNNLRKNLSSTNLRNSKASKLTSRDNSHSRLRINKDTNSSNRRKYQHLRHEGAGVNDNPTRPQVHNFTEEEQGGEIYGNGLDHDTSNFSQQSLKNQIFKIDKEIMDIQRTLNQQLQIYQ